MDITERKKYQKEIEYISRHDYMTKAYNRHFFEEEMKRLNCFDCNIALIVADINGLKMVNDAFGNEQGDYMLKTVVQAMNEVCSTEDKVFRIGGDEFVVLMTNPENLMKMNGKAFPNIQKLAITYSVQ